MAYTEFYCQTTGDNTNAGSTTSNTPAYTSTNGNWNSATGVFTPSDGSNPSLSVNVGDWASVYIDGATLAVYIALVTAVTATTITVSLTFKSGTVPVTSATTRTIKVGGAWKGPNGAVIFPFNFLASTTRGTNDFIPRVNFKTGTYGVTASLTANQTFMTYQGYTNTPGDYCPGGRPVFDFTGSSMAAAALNSTVVGCLFADMIFQNNGNLVNLFLMSSNSIALRILAKTTAQTAINLGGGSTAIECEAYDYNRNTNAGIPGIEVGTGSVAIRCIAHDSSVGIGGGTTWGYRVSNGVCIGCIAYGNQSIGFLCNTTNFIPRFIGCDAYNNGTHGFSLDTASNTNQAYLENCNAFKNGGYGYNCQSGSLTRLNAQMTLFNCASGQGRMKNTSGRHNNFNITDVDPILYPSGDVPWKDIARNDFTLVHPLAKNSGRGRFNQFQQASQLTRGYPDVGAASAYDLASVLNFDSPRQGIY